MSESTLNLSEALAEAIRTALRQWHQGDPTQSPLKELYIYRKLCRERKIDGRLATNALLLHGIEVLERTDEEAAKLIRNRYLDGLSVAQTAHQRNVAESTVFVLQRQATEQLCHVIAREEAAAYGQQQAVMLRRLDFIHHTHLIGVEAQLQALLPLFTHQTPPWLIALEGLGGIGKTTLANALLRRLIDLRLIDDAAWVSARQTRFSLAGELQEITQPALTAEQLIEGLIQQLLPGLADSAPQRRLSALQSLLRETYHVIVIDNLETVTDVETLLPTLQQLANPTRFILTSRYTFFGEPTLYHFKLPELNQTDALQLIRQEANWSSLPVLATAAEKELLPIYETVGGNPLALRLVVGQTHLYPLGSILADLQGARSETADKFYTYIYWKAWQKLDELHRRALLVMPLANLEGDELEYLAEIGDLDLDEMRMALNRLVTLNLVNGYGGLNERRYAIHSLTRTFLVKQVGKWL